ncbi:MAG: alkane 1-monooxygenase [Leptonema sp. (in: bacteria)]
MFKYLRFYITPALFLLLLPTVFYGGWWLWFPVLVISLVMIVGDAITGNDYSKPEYKYTFLLNLPLYLTLPVCLLALSILLWYSQTGNQDFLNLGYLMSNLMDRNVFALREETKWYHLIGAGLTVGFVTGGYGINVAHELTHRTWDQFAVIWGRWILAVSNSTDFSVEHVYGHHETVGTLEDPATARRGENVYKFILRSWLGSIKNSWKLETNRLRKLNKPIFSHHNQVIRGHLMSIVFVAIFFYFGGWVGLGLYFLQAFWARTLLEIVNYMEHYGLVRIPGAPVEPKHSWNTNRRISSLILFSLTRHSAHHEKGDLPFWVLDPYKEAPEMPYGYLTTIYICMIPPLWYKVINPRLKVWDEKYANPEERKLLETYYKTKKYKMAA